MAGAVLDHVPFDQSSKFMSARHGTACNVDVLYCAPDRGALSPGEWLVRHRAKCAGGKVLGGGPATGCCNVSNIARGIHDFPAKGQWVVIYLAIKVGI